MRDLWLSIALPLLVGVLFASVAILIIEGLRENEHWAPIPAPPNAPLGMTCWTLKGEILCLEGSEDTCTP